MGQHRSVHDRARGQEEATRVPLDVSESLVTDEEDVDVSRSDSK
jgi:hypothetical protein